MNHLHGSSTKDPSVARILVRRGDLEKARDTLAKIYAHATPKQVDLKVSPIPVIPVFFTDYPPGESALRLC